MNGEIPTYRPFGEPATGLIEVLRPPIAGKKVTVDGVDYTAGTHFAAGATIQETAQNIASAINADVARTHNQFNTQPIRKVYAIWYNSKVRVIATAPGTAGNSITLTTSDVTYFTVSSATLSGGTSNPAPVEITTSTGEAGATEAKQDTQITAEQAIQAAVEKVISATTAASVTPSDATALTSRAVWVGGAGDLSVRLSGAPSTTVVFTAVPAGTILPISVVRVMAATTATNINTLN